MKSRDQHASWLGVTGAIIAGVSIAIVAHRRRKQQQTPLSHHEYHLNHIQRVRRSLSKPRHSRFRVVCKMILDNNQTILGANDEASPFIGGALCAERAALCQYRLLYGTNRKTPLPRITHLYIVSDAPTPITPGCLCREYLYGHPGTDAQHTAIILQSCDASSPFVTTTLTELYPHPSPMVHCVDSTHAVQVLQDYAARQQSPPPDATVNALHQAATKAATQALEANGTTTTRQLYPIAFGAAALCTNENNDHTTIVVAHQCPALEYGCTLDAVSALLASTCTEYDNHEKTKQNQITMILQCDQFGTIHPPFAPARSTLSERYPKMEIIIVKNDTNVWQRVQGCVLAPNVPNIFFP